MESELVPHTKTELVILTTVRANPPADLIVGIVTVDLAETGVDRGALAHVVNAAKCPGEVIGGLSLIHI